MAYIGTYQICQHILNTKVEGEGYLPRISNLRELEKFLLHWQNKLGLSFRFLCEDVSSAIQLNSTVHSEEDLSLGNH